MYLELYSEAAQAYQQAIQLNPQHADALSTLGMAWLALQKDANARQAFEQALQYDPHHADTLQYLSQLQNRSTP